MKPCSYHTHTFYCDGEDSPEALLQEALRLGCPEIGFSGHSYTPFDPEFCMSLENTKRYRRDILALKERYAASIRVYLGIEQDFYAPCPEESYEYIIGSVHYLKVGGKYWIVDKGEDSFCTAVKECFDGDYYALAEEYYKTLGEVYEKTGCDIVGHFDLVCKFNEGNRLFDPSHPRYMAAVTRALTKLQKAPVLFEINTGAMARGYRTSPYPAPPILSLIREIGKAAIHTSYLA